MFSQEKACRNLVNYVCPKSETVLKGSWKRNRVCGTWLKLTLYVGSCGSFAASCWHSSLFNLLVHIVACWVTENAECRICPVLSASEPKARSTHVLVFDPVILCSSSLSHAQSVSSHWHDTVGTPLSALSTHIWSLPNRMLNVSWLVSFFRVICEWMDGYGLVRFNHTPEAAKAFTHAGSEMVTPLGAVWDSGFWSRTIQHEAEILQELNALLQMKVKRRMSSIKTQAHKCNAEKK